MEHKPIYLDGVDVSGCEYACNTAFGKNGCKHPMMKNIYCFKNPNCYFKQLARKTQECEELKNNLHIANTNHEAAEKECDRYLEALEEIEEYINQYEMLGKLNIKYILDIINKAKGEG